MPSDLVTSTVAARMIDVSRQRVHQLVAEGQLRAMRVETTSDRGLLVFRRSEVERFIRDNPQPVAVKAR